MHDSNIKLVYIGKILRGIYLINMNKLIIHPICDHYIIQNIEDERCQNNAFFKI